jgi:hypothetical protein
MSTAVERVGPGKEREVKSRFAAMASHYLFETEFCNRAAGWEKRRRVRSRRMSRTRDDDPRHCRDAFTRPQSKQTKQWG